MLAGEGGTSVAAARSADAPDVDVDDYANCEVERKSTSGTCQFLGRSLVSWSSKKQNSVALSTAEDKYVVAGACCA